ncbi:MAG: T9SS type A sorting domain-containing protein [Cyclobacteriaceae bacterium]
MFTSFKLKLIVIILLSASTTIAQDWSDLYQLTRLDPGLPESGRNGSYLGKVVGNIGDVNGDGFEDFAIGLPDCLDYESLNRYGKVYIYFGGSALQSEKDPDLILEGEEVYGAFGASISTAGDVNGDGYQDFLIGDPNGAERYGKVYLYFGGETLDADADLVFIGLDQFAAFGVALTGGFDMNNDGFDDIIIGANYPRINSDDAPSFGAGSAYIIYGGTSMDSMPDLVLSAGNIDDNFGAALSSGDFNGDGYDDVVIGSDPLDYFFISNGRGAAYVYYGGNVPDEDADIIFYEELTYNQSDNGLRNSFASTLAFAGDINNDGYDDIIIGASGYDFPQSDSIKFGVPSVGRAFIFLGGLSPDTIPDITLKGESYRLEYGFRYGSLVSGIGDMNNDGYDDFLVAAASISAASSLNHIYLGSASLDEEPDLTISSAYAYSSGDINNDGYDDVLVGDVQSIDGGNNSGQVRIYNGGDIPDDKVDFIVNGEKGGDAFGHKVSDAGDFNGDGYADIIMIKNLTRFKFSYKAELAIFLGSSDPDNAPDLVQEFYFDTFNSSISYAGDINSDGFDDIIIGTGVCNFCPGRSYIYYGSSSPDLMPDLVLPGSKYGDDNFGFSVSDAGDVNNDGYDDVIVGAPYAVGRNRGGLAYIYFGGATPDSLVDLSFSAEGWLDNFGGSVSGAGDINGDGIADVIVGASGNDAGGNSSGRAYVYFGGVTLDTLADLIITGSKAEDRLGLAVSGAGDVNNDGYDDLLIASDPSGSGLSNHQGHVSIYLGGSLPDTISDITLKGNRGGFLGEEMEELGDINDDGFDDFILGYRYGAFIYLGGSPLDTLVEGVPNMEFSSAGYSVSGGGDVNGDGQPDFLLGNPNSRAVGSNMGMVYWYVSNSGKNELLSIGDQLKDDELLISAWPNPFKENLKINFHKPIKELGSEINLSVVTLSGQLVYKNTLSTDRHEEDGLSLDLHFLSRGIYLLNIETSTMKNQAIRIIKR